MVDFGLNESEGKEEICPPGKGYLSPDPFESVRVARIQTVESEPSGVVVAETATCVHCRSKNGTEDNGVDMSKYNDLLGRYEELLEDYEKSMNEVSNLRIQLHKLPRRVPQELRERDALLQKENDELRSQISEMETDQESLRQRCISLEEVNQQLRSQVVQPQSYKVEGANIAKESVEQPRPVRVRTRQLRRKSRDNSIEELIHLTQIYLDPTIGGHAKENNLLAAQIAEMTNLNPKYAEADYFRQFNEINDEIEMWVVKRVNDISPGTLSKVYKRDETRYASLVSGVKALDDNAGRVLETQKAQLFSDPENRRKYIALMRHVIAIFLQSQIFRLFMFGLDRKELADRLNRLENEICTNGLHHLNNQN